MTTPMFKLSPASLINKTHVVYGPTGSGKSVIVHNLMYELRRLIPTCIVICPTEDQDKSYSKFVDPIYIMSSMGGDCLPRKTPTEYMKQLIMRQKRIASIYTRAQELSVLMGFLRYFSPSDQRHIKDQLSTLERRVVSKKMSRAEAEEECDKSKVKMLRAIIVKNIVELLRNVEDPEDKVFLQNFTTIPHLLLILDDCSQDVKDVDKKVWEEIFYNGRHLFMTTIFCLHDDMSLNPGVRANAFCSYFTKPNIALSFFMRSSNNFSSDQRKKVLQALADIKDSNVEYMLLVYVRDDATDTNFYRYKFDKMPHFKFGSKTYQRFAKMLKTSP